MSYAELVSTDIRLRVLQALECDPDYSHNEDVVRMALGAAGHNISRDLLRTELYWLKEQGALTLEDHDGLIVVTLTSRGEDIALGRARVPGIKRPGPR
jgi:hypothetical protein|tara:strand:- start:500 stop:793 length:294 start_codon:yes stop_codon:yes gene_type:complete